VNFDTLGQRRSTRWLLVAGALFGIWAAFGSPNRGSVVSTWAGDVSAPVGASQEAAPPLSALFEQAAAPPAAPGRTNLAADPHDPNMPWGNPTDSTAAVMTQGYGVGSHAPAASWGSVDIAIDGDGDGNADPRGSHGAPVYATMRGVVKATPDSVPAGNHIWVSGEQYKIGYAHLSAFAVETGQVVERGTLIGYMGSTGQSSGPHLDYQVWKDGVNQNPLDYGAMTK
jgi:murein DD-endopeptidase MepM/ murein hydrolase activator NlpD